MKSKAIVVSFLIAVGFLILGVYVSSSTSRLRAQIEREMKLGVREDMTTYNYLVDGAFKNGGIASWAYESGHPFEGRTMIFKTRPALSIHDVHVFVLYDKPISESRDGKELRTQAIYVSDSPIHPYKLPPEIQKHLKK